MKVIKITGKFRSMQTQPDIRLCDYIDTIYTFPMFARDIDVLDGSHLYFYIRKVPYDQCGHIVIREEIATGWFNTISVKNREEVEL